MGEAEPSRDREGADDWKSRSGTPLAEGGNRGIERYTKTEFALTIGTLDAPARSGHSETGNKGGLM